MNFAARRRLAMWTAAAGAVMVSAGAMAGGLLAKDDRSKSKRVAHATLVNAAGQKAGTVRFERRGKSRSVLVTVRARMLSPGFHGFHVHSTGKCDGPEFTSAGPHLNASGANHPNHAGDMPPLLVSSEGKGEARFSTERFSIADLRDADGSAVIVHAMADNHANIPLDRYDPDPDAMTLATGDSGARVLCGLVR